MLLNFDQGTINTPIFDYKLTHDIDLTSQNNFTWYFDFSSSKLSFVSRDQIDPNLSYYDDAQGTFYFLPTDDAGSYETIKSYAIDSKEVNSLSTNLLLLSARKLQACNNTICLIGSQVGEAVDNESVYTIDRSSGDMKKVLSSDGPILPTPDATSYAVFGDEEDGETANSVQQIYRSLTITDISTNEESRFVDDFVVDTISIGKVNDRFYYLDGGDGNYMQLTRGMKESPLIFDEETGFDEGFINLSLTGNNFSLIANTDRVVYIIAADKSVQNSFTVASRDTVESATESCVKAVRGASYSPPEENSQEVEFLIPDPGPLETFTRNYNTINSCLGEKEDIQLGYTYRFRGTSLVNGRITTD